MSKHISIAEVDQAAAELAQAKEAMREKQTPARREKLKAAAVALSDLRAAWREQEVEAGRRSVGVTAGKQG